MGTVHQLGAHWLPDSPLRLAFPDAFREGQKIGNRAGQDFTEECPQGDHEAGASFARILKVALGNMLLEQIARGASDDERTTWLGGLGCGIAPYALAWNFDPA